MFMGAIAPNADSIFALILMVVCALAACWTLIGESVNNDTEIKTAPCKR